MTEQAYQTVNLIQGILYLVPLAGLIWKLSSIAHQVKENKKDIDGLASKQRGFKDDWTKDNGDITQKVGAVSLNIAEISIIVNHIKDDIHELKTDMKEIQKISIQKQESE